MAIYLHGKEVSNVFGLWGRDENSGTFALGWALDQSIQFRALVSQAVFGIELDAEKAIVTLQDHGRDGGYTDIELRSGQNVHAIFEAKLSWELPTLTQLARYIPRFVKGSAAHQRLVSVSAAHQAHAYSLLPSTIQNVGVCHLSWNDLQTFARRAEKMAAGIQEKVWLRQLLQHLQEFVSMERKSSNNVYMVVLQNKSMVAGKNHTWIDVLEKDGSYFHPVGNGRNRWPPQPQNYVGFRYGGRLRSVHHVDSFEVVNDVSTVNPLWLKTNVDHFVYRLGPPMHPVRELKNGNIYPNARFECAIDTLLSGACTTIREAYEETKRRQRDLAS